MRRILLLISLLLLKTPHSVTAQDARHQRLIVTGGTSAPFATDPVTGRRYPGAMPAVAGFAELWRTELGKENLFLVDVPAGWSGYGFVIYDSLTGSGLHQTVREWTGYTPAGQADSVLALFGLTRAAVADSLTGTHDWLVADRYSIGELAAVNLRRQPVEEVRPSRLYLDNFSRLEQQVREFFFTPVIELENPVSTRDSYFGPSAFSALFHRFHREVSGADVSFFAPPQPDVELPPGSVALRDVLRLFTYENALVTVRVSGSQIQEFMEEVFGMRFFSVTGPESDMVRLRVPYYLHDDVSGLRFRVDLTARSGRRVKIYETERGEKFDPKKEYTVVLNSFRAGYFVRKGVPVRVVTDDYRLALARWLIENPQTDPTVPDNWSAAPERWVEAIRRRERRTLFEK